MEQTFKIDGSTYTKEELIDILREQFPGLRKYSSGVVSKRSLA